MQYVENYSTPDKIKYKETYGEAYFDKRGILKQGYCNKIEVQHFAVLALMEWGKQNTHIRKIVFKKNKLRDITFKTNFNYEVKILVSMLHWDNFNKSFKVIMINSWLKKRGTSFKKELEKSHIMSKEQERLFAVRKFKGMGFGICFYAAACIQEWWLRKKRKYRIYKNVYQLMDEYSVKGGFTGQNSEKYFGVGKEKNLLNIQEDIMKKVEMRRVKCRKVAKKFVENILQKKLTKHHHNDYEMIYLPPAPTHTNWTRETPPVSPSCDEEPEGDIGPRSSGGGWLNRWARRLGLTR